MELQPSIRVPAKAARAPFPGDRPEGVTRGHMDPPPLSEPLPYGVNTFRFSRAGLFPAALSAENSLGEPAQGD